MNVRRLGPVLGLAFSIAFLAALDARAHSGNTVEGTLYHQVGNPNPRLGGGAIRNYFVRDAGDGHVVPVDLSGASLPSGGINRALNKRVRVTAAPAVAAQALQRNQKFIAQKLEIVSAQPAPNEAVFPITGSRQYISLLCRWGGDASEPRAYTFFQTQLGDAYPGFNHYFQEISYGLANITGSGAMTLWVSMPQPRTFYDSGVDDGSYLDAMAQDCITAAEPYVNFSAYEGVNLMFNGLVDDCCAWGGGGVYTLEGLTRGVSVTWMPYWGNVYPGDTFGWLHHGVLAHELAHSFGSPHSNDPAGQPYGNYWDVVSRPGGPCTTVDAAYGCVGQHPVGDNKLAMGFIPGARLATHPVSGASTTYNIERMANPPNVGGTYQLLKVLTSNSLKYYTVESRLRTSYDLNLPGDGVIIHEVIDNRPFISPSNPGDPARLLTPTGTTAINTGDIDARWSAGNVYINTTDNVKITVQAFDAATGTATIVVQPATDPGTYSFALAGYTVTEGGPAINVAVTRTAPYATAGSVTWTTANGTAIAGSDFGTAGNAAQRTGTLTWTAGTGGTKNITVGLSTSNIPVINEGAAESSETFAINLSAPTGGVLGAQSSTTVTVADGAVIYFGGATTNVNENGPNATVNVQRSGSTAGTNAVTYTTINGTAMAGSDFGTSASTIQPTGTVTFAPGETSKNITVGPTTAAAPYIRVLDDTTVEPPETFTIRLSAPTNGAIVPVATRDNVVTINSNENGVGFAAGTVSYSEGAGSGVVGVTRSGSSGAVSVNYAFSGGTAVNGVHYTGTSSSLSWADGESGTKDIPFNLTPDAGVNTNRTFNVTLSGALGATITAPASKTVTITDDDNSVQFPAPTVTTSEGLAGGNLTLTLNRTGLLTDPATVTYTTVDGTGLAGTDFGVLGNATPVTGTVSWAGGVGGSKTFTIPILNDTTVEGVKNFRVQLSNPVGTNLSIGTNSEVLVTLNDNDAGVRWEFASYEVTEGTASVSLKVQRIGPATTAASATWATVNGTATSGSDFGLQSNFTPRTGTVSWLAGDATAKTITIPILNDVLGGEGDETFTVTLTPGAGLVLGSPGVATVTIHDNDIPPESAAEFSAPKYMVIEGAPNVQLTVNRVDVGGGFGRAASVNYSLQPGTALATSDYTVSSGTLTWGAGLSDAKTITIGIVNNTAPEPPEHFKVLLSGNTPGLGINTPEATVLIFDDDEAFPLDGVMPSSMEVPVGATAGWHVSGDPGAYEGAFTLKNDPINDSETAEIQMDGTFAAGAVNFRVKVSTEANFDVLTFYVDGVPRQSWSGISVSGWQMATAVTLTPGPHVLKWVYQKDGSVSVGADAVYIDSLTTPAFTP